jgi:hypothetical protein
MILPTLWNRGNYYDGIFSTNFLRRCMCGVREHLEMTL